MTSPKTGRLGKSILIMSFFTLIVVGLSLSTTLALSFYFSSWFTIIIVATLALMFFSAFFPQWALVIPLSFAIGGVGLWGNTVLQIIPIPQGYGIVSLAATTCATILIQLVKAVARSPLVRLWPTFRSTITVVVGFGIYVMLNAYFLGVNDYGRTKMLGVFALGLLPSIGVLLLATVYDVSPILKKIPYIVLTASFIISLEIVFIGTGGQRSTIGDYNPIWAGRDAGRTVLLALLVLYETSKANKNVWWTLVVCALVSAVGFVGLVATGSRGPLFALGLTIIILLVSRETRPYLRVAKGIVMVLVILAIFLVDPGNYLLRGAASFGEEVNILTRADLYMGAVGIWLRSPVFGQGIGSFGEIHGYGRYPHNLILEIISELGLVGFILFGLAFLRPVLKAEAKNIYWYLTIYALSCAMFSGDLLGNVEVLMSSSLLTISRWPRRLAYRPEVETRENRMGCLA